MSENVFRNIYLNAIWSQGESLSGPGSDLRNTSEYMSVLRNFLDLNKITSVVDLGCGDWQFSQHVNWDGIDYTGIDCFQELIDQVKKYEKPNIQFRVLDFYENVESIPKADLCILKDVLQHWPDTMVNKFLTRVKELKLFKYILITNCYNGPFPRNCVLGDFKPLSPYLPPLSDFNPIILSKYSTKIISLI